MDIPGEIKELQKALALKKPEDFWEHVERALSKAYMEQYKTEEPDPCQSQVESVEVKVQTCIRTKTKEVVSRSVQTYKLDSNSFNLNQRRRITRQHDPDGKTIHQEPVGSPILVLHGEVIGAENDSLLEPRHPDLRAEVENVANLVKFTMIWKDTLVYQHETTEQDLLDAPFRTHVVQIMHRTLAGIKRIDEEHAQEISFGQIRRALFDISKETMEAYQL
jgi:hypothetical protein